MKHKLRKWQTEALASWKPSLSGIVKIVTGAGKTYFAHACIDHFLKSQPTGKVFIAVPSLSLLDQWLVSIQEDLGLDESDISLFSSVDKRTSFRTINIGVNDSLRRLESVPSNSMLVVDECHRIASPKNRAILDHCFSATLGLSATPDRQYDQGLEDIMIPRLGEVIYEYGLTDALNDQILSPFELMNIKISFLPDEEKTYKSLTKRAATAFARFEKGEGSWDIAKRALIARRRFISSARLRVPVALKTIQSNKDARTIIFHENIKQANEILNHLRNIGFSATIYHSRIGPKIRRDNLRLFRRGMIRIMVCCRALDEGIDVPSIEVGIIASSTSSHRQRVQRLGRVLRPSKGKTHARVYTLYVTDVEEKALIEEACDLADIVSVSWSETDNKTS